MSFVFRGSRADLESGFPGFIPERRTVRVHAARPVNSNSLAFLVTVLLLFMILNSHQMSSNFLLWLVIGVFLLATTLRMYATCQQLQAQAQAHAAVASGLLGHTELRLHMPPPIAFATRGRLQGLRLQLALLDREFDDLDYETLRALDADNVPTAASMSEEEINALPVHKYKGSGSQSCAVKHVSKTIFNIIWELNDSRETGFLLKHFVLMASIDVCYDKTALCQCVGSSMHRLTRSCFIDSGSSSMQQASSSGSAEQKKLDMISVGSMKAEDELTCTVCLEQVSVGEIVRSLPCLHQFHANCIDPWLRQQGTCPVCKLRAGSGWHETRQGEMDASYMV
ncbi:hypothetical protein JRO89_XS14G0070400 [Xanthoceras sorbifolium]|uniref:RING-type E3 ubiquitin transferase n=1 Tax=Xanthoceras sorbifolium TaxID=99658 RepID=A0ABQ8H496_9ROSI|nr:hypothetical protein JRO89_XS14G0070400 [Xanthoceras sorbifolium]